MACVNASRIVGAALLSVSLVAGGCNTSSGGNDRWVTTENSAVDIDWDAVAKAYREAEGPEDFERRVNEIYTGPEVVSVGVHDLDDKTQEVTGFFDTNTNGTIEESEKVFTIRREITGEGTGNYRVQGHGHYASYRSPFWDIAAGMVVGSMISRAFRPNYVPMYTQPYSTPPARRTALVSQRDAYRKANPAKTKPTRSGAKSQSGRSYGRQGNNFGKGKPTSSTRPRSSTPRPRTRMGGRFGAGSAKSRTRVFLG